MSEMARVIVPEDRTLFSLHEEDEMTERLFHSKQLAYFDTALSDLLPEHFVAVNMAVYWVPGRRQHPYVGPDLLVARGGPAEENPSVYLTYEDGPIAFVIEVASEKSRAGEARKRDETYGATLQIPEYLYVDQERDQLELWRLDEGVYQQMAPDAQGWLWSRELGVGFAWQEDRRLVRVLTSDGVPVPTSQEARALRQDAETRARQESERARREAQRATREARQRREAEARVEELAAEVERLRRMLESREVDEPRDPSG